MGSTSHCAFCVTCRSVFVLVLAGVLNNALLADAQESLMNELAASVDAISQPDRTKAEVDRISQELAEGRKGSDMAEAFVRFLAVSSSGMEESMAAAVLFHSLKDKGHINDNDIIEGASRLLGDDDDTLVRQAENLLGEVETEPLRQRPQYGQYQSFFNFKEEQNQEVSPGLFSYLFKQNAGEAFDLMLITRGEKQSDRERRDLLWNKYIVADFLWRVEHEFAETEPLPQTVVDSVDHLAQSHVWWARLYAAEVMRQHPELRQTELVRTLRKDEHDLVRQVAEEIHLKGEPGRENGAREDG